MIRTGTVIENPVTGERIVFRKTSRDTGGQGSRDRDLLSTGRFRRHRPSTRARSASEVLKGLGRLVDRP
jgi:hypothetical protein